MNNSYKHFSVMIQGCTSDAGKSTIVTALCRALKNKDMSVAPFKPQNMALNSAVTRDGGEIGRAQAVQAQAAGLEPMIDMNPVLLKPHSDRGAQVIVRGFARTNMQAVDYYRYKKTLLPEVIASFNSLQQRYGFIAIEGAGSPAEINLRENDIANMGFAEAIDCPVIIVADIDRGGVFAHLVGTLELLRPSEQQRVIGFIINRFRGDVALLQPGIDWLEQKTGVPVIGVMPYLHQFHLEAEDAIKKEQNSSRASLNVVVPVLPRISNHTDFDVLRLHPQVNLQFVDAKAPFPACDLIILPGSKSVRHDLAYLQQHGWQEKLQRHLRYGGKIIGICGGMQMLGMCIHDPDGIEGTSGSSQGFGYLDYETILTPEKALKHSEGLLFGEHYAKGYEIHCGVSYGPALNQPAVSAEQFIDGAVSQDQQILSTYLHGIFDQPTALNALLNWAGLAQAEDFDHAAETELEIERLSDSFIEAINVDNLLQRISQFYTAKEKVTAYLLRYLATSFGE